MTLIWVQSERVTSICESQNSTCVIMLKPVYIIKAMNVIFQSPEAKYVNLDHKTSHK